MKTIAFNVAPRISLATIVALLVLSPSLSRGADRPRIEANDESKPEQMLYLGGEVKIPGRYPYTNGMTLGSAIKMAKGLTDKASQTKVEITRGTKKLVLDRKRIEATKNKDIKLEPGDRIFVPRKS